MKVLHITIGDRWAGVAAHMHSLLPRLRGLGVDVSCMVFAHGLLGERLRESGIDVRVLERRKKYDLRVIAQIRKFLKENSVDLIHMHGYMAIVYGCLASLIGGSARRVVTFHQPSQPFREIRDRKFRYSLIFAYRLAKLLGARFIAVSRDILKSYVDNYGLSASDVELIHNGIEPLRPYDPDKRLALRRDLGIADDHAVVSIVGRLDPIKGHTFFIDSAKQLCENGAKITFLILGDGELRGELEALVERYGLADRIRFLGFQKDIHRFLALTDILVISSMFEGIPYTLLEAMSLGARIVATRVGGLGEVIEDHRDGLLVAPRSATEIAGAISKILQDQSLAHTLGENARSRITGSFTAGRMAEETLNLYRRVVGMHTQDAAEQPESISTRRSGLGADRR